LKESLDQRTSQTGMEKRKRSQNANCQTNI
jgi:hypothetical protein